MREVQGLLRRHGPTRSHSEAMRSIRSGEPGGPARAWTRNDRASSDDVRNADNNALHEFEAAQSGTALAAITTITDKPHEWKRHCVSTKASAQQATDRRATGARPRRARATKGVTASSDDESSELGRPNVGQGGLG